MSFAKIIKRELEVAFSKNAQPVALRVAKYVLLGFLFYFYWNTPSFLLILLVLFGLALSLHFWYRYKTHAWTKSYGGWNYEKNKP